MPPESQSSLLEVHPAGLYCAAGDFYIDPWEPVDRAVVTHAHADHARPGSRHYLTASDGLPLLRLRLGSDATIETLDYGESKSVQGVQLSLHPAGHMRGSAQVRLERRGQVVVVTGDYKRTSDPTTLPFEPLKCDLLVTEATFGLPIYRWPPVDEVVRDILSWWHDNQQQGRASVIYAYAMGKAQRLLAELPETLGPILTHGAIEKVNAVYRSSGVQLPETRWANAVTDREELKQALIIAPPSAHGSRWLKRFGVHASAMVSGWMRVRGMRRRRSLDRGFVLSDHADWQGLLTTIRDTEASQVRVTHGASATLARYLREQMSLSAAVLETHFQGETLVGDPWEEDEDGSLHPSAQGDLHGSSRNEEGPRPEPGSGGPEA